MVSPVTRIVWKAPVGGPAAVLAGLADFLSRALVSTYATAKLGKETPERHAQPRPQDRPWLLRGVTGKDLDRAMSYIASDVVCNAPAGRIEGAEAYRGFMAPFVEMLIASELIAAFGDDEKALVMYDTETRLVKSAPGAECVTVRDGEIVHSWFVFDRAPFQAARHARAEQA